MCSAREPAEGHLDIAARIAGGHSIRRRGGVNLPPKFVRVMPGCLVGGGRCGVRPAMEKQAVVLFDEAVLLSSKKLLQWLRFSPRDRGADARRPASNLGSVRQQFRAPEAWTFALE